MAAAVALMTGSGIPAAVAQPVPGRALAQVCSSATGYLVNGGNPGLGVDLAPHNQIDTVTTYPNPVAITHMGFHCVGVTHQGDPIWVIGAGGLCLDEGSASQHNLVFSEGCNDSLTTERWIYSGGQLENNHFGNCLSSGNANSATLGGRSCSPTTTLNEWDIAFNDLSDVCSSATGYLVNGNVNGSLGVHVAPHNGFDTVATYPGPGVTHIGMRCVGVTQGDPIWVIGAGGLCLDEGSASQQHVVFSEGCNDSLSTERWIYDGGQLENNHFGNCLSSGNASGVTLGGRSCSPTNLNDWFVFFTDN